MLDREVTLVPRVESEPDARGNVSRTDGTALEGIPAARELVAATEDTADDDQQARTFRYFLPAYVDVDGERIPIEPLGYDRLVDGDVVFELRGDPEIETRRRRWTRHHVEAIAYLIEG